MPKRSTYHHGDLKATLVSTALEVIAEQGIAAVSVAEVARRAGVSTAAPYRHFASKQALLIACAIAAANALATQILRAQEALGSQGEATDPVEATAAASAAYTRFAAENGSGLDLIFAPELQNAGDEGLLRAGRAVMDALLPSALAVTGGDARSALELLERQIAAAHGYAALLRSGFLSRRHPTVDDIASHAAAIARSLARETHRRSRA
ncbi:TetR/AcrR family transcriptional regulator [Streptomyces sp. NEAU-H3]|uniref:TetR/AcrR family transcriptional regulator n=1 Tax=Streptomyces sp. NEAU-H3 TaxID=2720636 RepID=UPI00143C1AC9|nr:TetR/AcrR family transcriptional regulator [Streptomyces sp. NEAU-H3]NJA57126.1 helix-turn-helix transcriptional regulator [Streptomyces sp. NEAU-H3]